MRLLFVPSVALFMFLFLSAATAHGEPAANGFVTQIPGDDESVAITSWLVAGPLASPYIKGGSHNAALRVGYDFDFLQEIGGEENARISQGTEFHLPEGTVSTFLFQHWETPFVDLAKVLGNKPMVCAYLYAEIESLKDQTVYFHVGTNDAGKVWVGGELIVQYSGDRGAERSQHVQQVDLKAGRTSILAKIDQAGGGWGTYIELYGKEASTIFLLERKARDKGKNLDDPDCIATHIETKVICKQVDRYIGWPTIAKNRTGELLAVFSGNRDAHVCPYGVNQMIRSTDHGKTWSEPITINNTPLDDRDAGILQTESGALILSWFTSLAFDTPDFYEAYPQWKRHSEKLSLETREHWLGNWTRRSLDNGNTWEEPVKQNITAPHGPIQLAGGRLLYVGTGSKEGKVLGVEESRDDGQSWQFISTIDVPADESIGYYSEPHVAELGGKIVAMFRYTPTVSLSYLRQSESYDGGKTWTTAHETAIWGYPPHLTVLDNGWLLVVYGVRRQPYSERACISRDGGKTWDIENEIILTLALNGDLGYPASVQLDDGSIVTVYYQIDKPGEKACLMSTHWRLK